MTQKLADEKLMTMKSLMPPWNNQDAEELEDNDDKVDDDDDVDDEELDAALEQPGRRRA